MRHLRLYGYPELVDGAGTVLPFRTRKHLALLVYLALEARTRPLQRDHLIALFWGDVRERNARRSLYQALSEIRQRLGRDAFRPREPIVHLQ
ncbi:MAG: winged helix-turn-helix domain-containing protein, partial [Gemmatimonadales bacterium]|nr:winged helix-turn-helix domain-containing protein [Gemmatimonadales bacterium]